MNNLTILELVTATNGKLVIGNENNTINDIVINVDSIFGLKRDIFNEFLEEYHTKYKGNVTINNK